MHSKSLIIDASSALIGSANFTENGLVHSEEQICRIDTPAQVGAMVAHWEKAWSEAKPVTPAEMDAVIERRATYAGKRKADSKGAGPTSRS